MVEKLNILLPFSSTSKTILNISIIKGKKKTHIVQPTRMPQPIRPRYISGKKAPNHKATTIYFR